MRVQLLKLTLSSPCTLTHRPIKERLVAYGGKLVTVQVSGACREGYGGTVGLAAGHVAGQWSCAYCASAAESSCLAERPDLTHT